MFIIYVISLILSHSSYGQPQNEYDVIIMGAGSSGIAAAKTLHEANITNTLIIEAMDYIGGRAKVMNLSKYMLNIGASWISGVCIDPPNCSSDYTQINPMLAAAYKYNISFNVNAWSNGIILDFGGNEHNVTNSNNRRTKFREAQDCAHNIPYDNTRDNDMSYFATLNLCGWKPPHQAIDKTISLDAEQLTKWRTAFADKPYVNTYSTFGPQSGFITDPKGYQGIIEALANEFLDINDENKIIFNSPITAIRYDTNGIRVTLENTTEYSAKYGIVTFSLGVLQSDIIEFIPKLPSWKIDSFLAFDFIDYAPILVKWPYNFWNDTIGDADTLVLNDDRYGFFITIYNFDHSDVFPGSLIWRFNIKLDLAQMVQYQNINDTIKLIIDLKLSHYFDYIPLPDDIIVADWNSNKYFQGSWSNWPVGINYEMKERMGLPLLQRLFFAGEALNDFDYGYVHTAWFSGNDTANKILSCIGYDNGFDCPSEYIPSTPSDACKSDQSVFKDLVWLWIVLGILFGIILGYLFAKYYTKSAQNKSEVDNMKLPMVTQNTD